MYGRYSVIPSSRQSLFHHLQRKRAAGRSAPTASPDVPQPRPLPPVSPANPVSWGSVAPLPVLDIPAGPLTDPIATNDEGETHAG